MLLTPRVAGPQLHGEGLSGGVCEAVDRVEPEAALVVRRRLFLVLRVDLVQRPVDVQHDGGVGGGGCRPSPHRRPGLRHRLPQPLQGVGTDGAEGPVQRRVRRHGAEQRLLGAEAFDVGARLAAAGEHEHGLHQHLAPVVQREPLPGNRDAGGQRIAQAEVIGEGTKGV